MNPVIENGFQGFPECVECQCYPECRMDCPKHLECVRELPEYAERVFGSDQSEWPADVADLFNKCGYQVRGLYRPRKQQSMPDQPRATKSSWWRFWE